MKTKIIIFGTGGMAKLVIDILSQKKEFEIAGLIDPDPSVKGKTIHDLKVLGDIVHAQTLPRQGITAAAFAIGENAVRKSLYERLKTIFTFPALIDSSVHLPESTKVGHGSIICRGSILGPDVQIGNCVILNLNAVIGHSTKIEDYSNLGVGVKCAGRNLIKASTSLSTGVIITAGKTGEGQIQAGAVI